MDKGYLLHLTHYDPRWCAIKDKEKPFDLRVGMEIVDALAEEGFNLLFIGCSDGVRYKSHPELARKYSIPMKDLKRLVAHARKSGLEIVPKLNFSKSEINRHDNWIRTPDAPWHEDFEEPAYWKKAFEIIDEVNDVCEPERFFHVGMDEDHNRSHTQYAEAIKILHAVLKRRKLRTIVWNDTAINYASGFVYVEKMLDALDKIPKDIVHIIWNYRYVPEKQIKLTASKGFEVWGAPGRDAAQVEGFIQALEKTRKGKGLLMTTWMKCWKPNRKELLGQIHAMGPEYRKA